MTEHQRKPEEKPPELGFFDSLVKATDELIGDVFDVADKAVDAVGSGGSTDDGKPRTSEGKPEGGGRDNGADPLRAAGGPITLNLNLGKLLREAAGVVKPKVKDPKPPAPSDDEPDESATA